MDLYAIENDIDDLKPAKLSLKDMAIVKANEKMDSIKKTLLMRQRTEFYDGAVHWENFELSCENIAAELIDELIEDNALDISDDAYAQAVTSLAVHLTVSLNDWVDAVLNAPDDIDLQSIVEMRGKC